MKGSAPSLKRWPGFTDTAGEFNGVLQPCGTFGGGGWGIFSNTDVSALPIQPLTSGSTSFTVATFFLCMFLAIGVTVCSVEQENFSVQMHLKSSEDLLSSEPINSGIRYAAAASDVAGA